MALNVFGVPKGVAYALQHSLSSNKPASRCWLEKANATCKKFVHNVIFFCRHSNVLSLHMRVRAAISLCVGAHYATSQLTYTLNRQKVHYSIILNKGLRRTLIIQKSLLHL